MDDDAVERTLRAARPRPIVQPYDSRLETLAQEATSAPHQAHRKGTRMRFGQYFLGTKKRKLTSSLVAATLVLAPTIAVGGQVAARTGLFGNPANSEEGNSEYIDMCADGAERIIRAAAPKNEQLPATTSWQQIADHRVKIVAESCTTWENGYLQEEDGIKSTYYSVGIDAWTCTAERLHNAGKKAKAREALQQTIPLWEKFDEAQGGMDSSMVDLRDEILAGDWKVIKQVHKANNSCQLFNR